MVLTIFCVNLFQDKTLTLTRFQPLHPYTFLYHNQLNSDFPLLLLPKASLRGRLPKTPLSLLNRRLSPSGESYPQKSYQHCGKLITQLVVIDNQQLT